MFDGLYPPGDQWYWRADFVKEIPDEAVELHARFGSQLPSMKSTMHMYPIDGAAHDVAAGDTAWSYRDANWGAVFAGVDPDPANRDAIRSWSVDYNEALRPYSAGGAYVNMMMDEGEERVRASYRDNYERLARDQAQLRPAEPLPHQPEHPPGGCVRGEKGDRRRPGGQPGSAIASSTGRSSSPWVRSRPTSAIAK